MPTLLQIDSCLGVGSTGRITESIGNLAQSIGWKSYVAHGSRYVGKTNQISYQILSKSQEYFHIFGSLLTDKHGLFSAYPTKKLVSLIEEMTRRKWSVPIWGLLSYTIEGSAPN